jgi:hypothetical protein
MALLRGARGAKGQDRGPRVVTTVRGGTSKGGGRGGNGNRFGKNLSGAVSRLLGFHNGWEVVCRSHGSVAVGTLLLLHWIRQWVYLLNWK